MAVGITAATVILVSIIAFIIPIDVTGCGFVCLVLGILLTIFGFVVLIVSLVVTNGYSLYILKMVYGGVGAAIMCLYLLYDTQLMMGGKHKYAYSPEDYIFATLSLFLDIIILTLFILMCILCLVGAAACSEGGTECTSGCPMEGLTPHSGLTTSARERIPPAGPAPASPIQALSAPPNQV